MKLRHPLRSRAANTANLPLMSFEWCAGGLGGHRSGAACGGNASAGGCPGGVCIPAGPPQQLCNASAECDGLPPALRRQRAGQHRAGSTGWPQAHTGTPQRYLCQWHPLCQWQPRRRRPCSRRSSRPWAGASKSASWILCTYTWHLLRASLRETCIATVLCISFGCDAGSIATVLRVWLWWLSMLVFLGATCLLQRAYHTWPHSNKCPVAHLTKYSAVFAQPLTRAARLTAGWWEGRQATKRTWNWARRRPSCPPCRRRSWCCISSRCNGACTADARVCHPYGYSLPSHPGNCQRHRAHLSRWAHGPCHPAAD